MENMKKALNLNTKMEEQAAEREKRGKSQTGTVRRVAGKTNASGKTKLISAKVSPEQWALFTQINKARGSSNNSALNVLIAEFIKENKEYLD